MNGYCNFSDLISVIQQSESQSQSLSYQEEWKSLSCTVERIYQRAIYCDLIWKESKKSQGKRRALSELLKLLEASGLSRHKSIYLEVVNIRCQIFLKL